MEEVEGLPDARSKLMARRLAGAFGCTEDEANYHLWLLIDAGLIEGNCAGKPGINTTLICCGAALTWKGHELLDMVRTDKAWNRIKKWLGRKALDLSFEAILAAGRAVIGEA